MSGTVDIASESRVPVLCDLGDSAECGASVFCKPEQTIIPGKLLHPVHQQWIDNPSVVKFCTSEPRICPSRQAFLENHRTQQQESALAKRALEVEKDLDDEVLEEFVKPIKAGE